MGDKKQSTLKGNELVFQNGDGLNVKVIGGFIEYETLYILSKKKCQGDSILLSPAELSYLLCHICFREEKCLEVGIDMHMGTLHIDMVTAVRAKCLYECLFIVQHLSVLVKVPYAEVTFFDAAAVRLQTSQQKFKQGGFTCPINTHDRDLVPLQYAGRKVFDEVFPCNAVIHVFYLKEHFTFTETLLTFPTLLFTLKFYLHFTYECRVSFGLFTQFKDPCLSTLVSFLSGTHTFPKPLLFSFKHFYQGIVAFSHRLHTLLFLHKEVTVAPFVRDQFLIVHFDHTGGNGVNEVSVVGNEEQGEFLFKKYLFKEFHHVDIEVVGRFIEEQDIRFFQNE